jgi:hypothetical protein
MSEYEPDFDDPFAPPIESVTVECLHCDGVYQSSQMVYVQRFAPYPLWCCPNPQCSGAGFGCDLLPINNLGGFPSGE